MREIFTYGSAGRAPGDRCLYPELGNSVKTKNMLDYTEIYLHISC